MFKLKIKTSFFLISGESQYVLCRVCPRNRGRCMQRGQWRSFHDIERRQVVSVRNRQLGGRVWKGGEVRILHESCQLLALDQRDHEVLNELTTITTLMLNSTVDNDKSIDIKVTKAKSGDELYVKQETFLLMNSSLFLWGGICEGIFTELYTQNKYEKSAQCKKTFK